MRTNPFDDALAFFVGNTGDHAALGDAKYIMVGLYGALLIGGVAAAAYNLLRDPTQRTVRDICIWIIRTALGTMWFQGSLWKLPLPLSGGLLFWTGEMVKYSAFEWHTWLARELMLPYLAFLNPIVFLTEVGMATSLILGFATRLGGCIAVLFTINLWIGLYRDPAEWPWTYIFIIAVHGFLALDRAGRSLGVDAIIARLNSRDGAWSSAWRLTS